MSKKFKIVIIAFLFIFLYPNEPDAFIDAIDYISSKFITKAEAKPREVINSKIVMIDSDGDSVRDDVEVDNGTDPHNPESF